MSGWNLAPIRNKVVKVHPDNVKIRIPQLEKNIVQEIIPFPASHRVLNNHQSTIINDSYCNFSQINQQYRQYRSKPSSFLLNQLVEQQIKQNQEKKEDENILGPNKYQQNAVLNEFDEDGCPTFSVQNVNNSTIIKKRLVPQQTRQTPVQIKQDVCLKNQNSAKASPYHKKIIFTERRISQGECKGEKEQIDQYFPSFERHQQYLQQQYFENEDPQWNQLVQKRSCSSESHITRKNKQKLNKIVLPRNHQFPLRSNSVMEQRKNKCDAFNEGNGNPSQIYNEFVKITSNEEDIQWNAKENSQSKQTLQEQLLSQKLILQQTQNNQCIINFNISFGSFPQILSTNNYKNYQDSIKSGSNSCLKFSNINSSSRNANKVKPIMSQRLSSITPLSTDLNIQNIEELSGRESNKIDGNLIQQLQLKIPTQLPQVVELPCSSELLYPKTEISQPSKQLRVQKHCKKVKSKRKLFEQQLKVVDEMKELDNKRTQIRTPQFND